MSGTNNRALAQEHEPSDAEMALQARLRQPDAVLSRGDLRKLGYERRAVDAIFRACAVEVWPGYSRPLLRVGDFLEWRERCTYRDDRVRPTTRRAA
jgi:hypothetical protein